MSWSFKPIRPLTRAIIRTMQLDPDNWTFAEAALSYKDNQIKIIFDRNRPDHLDIPILTDFNTNEIAAVEAAYQGMAERLITQMNDKLEGVKESVKEITPKLSVPTKGFLDD